MTSSKLVRPTLKPVVVPDLRAVLCQVLDHVRSSPRWHVLDYAERIPRRGERALVGIHPSEIKLHMKCARSAAYAMLGTPRTEQPSGARYASSIKYNCADEHRTTICFNHGDCIHMQWQAYLLAAVDAGLLDGGGAEVGTASGHVVGTVDFVLQHGGQTFVVEIKSAGPSTYFGTKNMTDVKAAPMMKALPEHVEQAAAYMHALGAAGMFFIYADKATDDFAIDYVGARSARDPWPRVLVVLDGAKAVVDANDLPSRTLNTRTCGACPFTDTCLGTGRTIADFAGFDMEE